MLPLVVKTTEMGENRSNSEILDLGAANRNTRQYCSVTPLCLVGKIFADKTGEYFCCDWCHDESVPTKIKSGGARLGNRLILFSFDSFDDREWVINNQPWHFNDTLFIIKALNGSEQPSSIRITTTSFWIRAHDIPMDFRNEGIIAAIAQKLGNLSATKSHQLMIRRSLSSSKPRLT